MALNFHAHIQPIAHQRTNKRLQTASYDLSVANTRQAYTCDLYQCYLHDGLLELLSRVMRFVAAIQPHIQYAHLHQSLVI